MPRRKQFEENGVYHIYNRWFNKQKLFFTNQDYERFFLYLDLVLSDFGEDLDLISYCILSNHFHFLIKSKNTSLSISDFMRRVQASYTSYLRVKYPENFQKWSIFEWRFQSKQILTDEYFNKCLYYVNFNAVKHKIVDKIENYPHTSFHQFWDKNKKIIEWKGVKIKLVANWWFDMVFEDDFDEFEF